MENILTAEEYALENMQGTDMQEIESALIGFAKMHVKAALESAAGNAEGEEVSVGVDYDKRIVINKQSIIEAYPLENIK